MVKRMILSLYLRDGGGRIEKDLFYQGSSEEEIANLIMRDENELLEYMRTRDDHGIGCFCFCGFMFDKERIIAAQLSEPEFWEE